MRIEGISGDAKMFKLYNPNPHGKYVDDCVVRGLTAFLDVDWDTAFLDLCDYGYQVKNMPSVNSVWTGFLKRRGYKMYSLPNTCPDCYTVRDFCRDHKRWKYLLCTGNHVVAVVGGDYLDTADSGDMIPIFFFEGR